MVGIGVEEGGGWCRFDKLFGNVRAKWVFFYYYCYGDTLDQASNCICVWNAGCYFGCIL